MKKLLFISLLFICCGKSFGQAVNFSTVDSNLLYTDRNSSGLFRYNKLMPVYVNNLSRIDSSGRLKMLVVDTARAAVGLKSVYWINIPSGGGGGGGTVYVDSVSNNAGGDSLIVYKNGVRRAYVYPAGSSSNWVNDGSAVRINNNVLIGGAYTPAVRLQAVLANDATPLTVSSWDTRHAVFGATSSTGGGLAISRTSSTATTNILAVQPGVAWENIILNANSFKFMTTGTVQGLYQDYNGQVSVGPGTVYSGFQPNTGIGYKYNAQAGNYTLLGSDIIVEYAAAGTHTYTLPSSAGITGRTYKIINSGANALTVATISSQTFDNVTGTPTSLTLPAKSGIEVSSNGAGWLVSSNYVKTSQGADVASANNLVLNSGGYTFEITGTTQVNLIASTGWQNGSEVTLLLASGITIKHGQTTSGSNITISLSGATDLVTAAETSLTLVLSEVGGKQKWRQKGAAISY